MESKMGENTKQILLMLLSCSLLLSDNAVWYECVNAGFLRASILKWNE